MGSIAPVFRKAYELFWQYPALWLPVLIADACRFVIAETMTPLRRAVVSWLLPRSVFGSYAGDLNHYPWLAVIFGALMKWLVYGITVYLYLYAMGILARAVPLVQKGSEPFGALTAQTPLNLWPTFWRVLALYFVAFALVIAEMGMTAKLTLGAAYALLIPVAAMLVYVITPTLRRFADANGARVRTHFSNRKADFSLLLTAFLLSNALVMSFDYVSARDEGLERLSYHAVPWEALLLVVSLVAALPYVLAMIGFALENPQPDSSTLRDELPK